MYILQLDFTPFRLPGIEQSLLVLGQLCNASGSVRFHGFPTLGNAPPLEAGKKHGPRLSILAQPVVYKEMIFIQRHQSAGFTWIMICLIFGNFASISS